MRLERPAVWLLAGAVVAVALFAPRVPVPSDDAIVWLLVGVAAAPLAFVIVKRLRSP